MASPELDAKGIRAYALYTTFLVLPGLLLEHLTQYLLQDQLLAGVFSVVAWGFGLFRLATRFYQGQGRIPLHPEIRGIALRTAWYVAVGATSFRVLWAVATSSTAEWTLFGLTGGCVLSLLLTFIEYFPVLLIFLLPYLQERFFAAWSRRNK